MNEVRFDKKLFRAKLDELLRGSEVQHQEIFNKVESWMDSGKPGLLLMGSVGTGKSTIARAIRWAWCKFLTVADMKKCDWIADQIRADADWVNEIARARGLMVLDDLGTESKVWNEESMLPILFHRIDNWMPTVITTNLNSEQIRQRYGERVADRLRAYDKIVMNYESLRK